MKFVRKSIAILVVMLFMLFVAMFLMKSIQGGSPMTVEGVLQQGKGGLEKVLRDVMDFGQQVGPYFKDLIKKLPKP